MKPGRNIWLMYAIALLQGMVFYGPISALYRQSAGITIFQITVIERKLAEVNITYAMLYGSFLCFIGFWLFYLCEAKCSKTKR